VTVEGSELVQNATFPAQAEEVEIRGAVGSFVGVMLSRDKKYCL
jgi:hypothetical protein